jgi:GT2 family glycosyltransferase
MKLAENSVVAPVDYILWLNNDVSLSADFFSRILNSIAIFPKTILIGQTSDPRSNQITYGGLKRLGRHPHRLQLINAQEKHEVADTFCGNIVLIPYPINSSVGGIDGYFEHGFADYDFGYRAKRMGYDVRIIPGFLGTCSLNQDHSEGKHLWTRWRSLISKKHLPIRSQIHFCKRHGGVIWPIYVLYPFLRVFLKIRRIGSNQITEGFSQQR